MRILFTFIGGLGHFHPLAPVARAVAAAGHDVAVAGAGTLVAQVEAAGFEALPTSEVRPPRAAGFERQPLEPVDPRAAEVEFAENFGGRGARRHATALREHIGAWRPDVVVRDEADLGAVVAGEVTGIPVATVLVLASGMLVRPELVAPHLDAVRAEHGLPPDPCLRRLLAGLVLAPFPRSFRSPTAPLALPPSTLSFRSGAPPRVARTSSRPTSRHRVYVTLGTIFNTESGDLLERLLAGLADVDADVLMTVGRTVDPAGLGPAPPHVRVERFVPQDDVLPDTDLVVSHGGSGSLTAALAHGLPSVLLPLGADQPHNAVRATELGLARTLDAATATPDDIGRAVTEALADEPMADRARRTAAEIGALPGVDATVPLLEALTG